MQIEGYPKSVPDNVLGALAVAAINDIRRGIYVAQEWDPNPDIDIPPRTNPGLKQVVPVLVRKMVQFPNGR